MVSISADPKLSWIFVGGKKEAKNLFELKRKKIKYILNATPLRSEGGVSNFYQNEKNHLNSPLFTYCRISLQDNASERLEMHFEEAWDFFEKARIREDGGLLVHCNLGVSRSVSLVASYLIKFHRMTYPEALELIKACRSEAKPNDSFALELQQFDERLQKTGDYAALPQSDTASAKPLCRPGAPMPSRPSSPQTSTGVSVTVPPPARPGPNLPTPLSSSVIGPQLPPSPSPLASNEPHQSAVATPNGDVAQLAPKSSSRSASGPVVIGPTMPPSPQQLASTSSSSSSSSATTATATGGTKLLSPSSPSSSRESNSVVLVSSLSSPSDNNDSDVLPLSSSPRPAKRLRLTTDNDDASSLPPLTSTSHSAALLREHQNPSSSPSEFQDIPLHKMNHSDDPSTDNQERSLSVGPALSLPEFICPSPPTPSASESPSCASDSSRAASSALGASSPAAKVMCVSVGDRTIKGSFNKDSLSID